MNSRGRLAGLAAACGRRDLGSMGRPYDPLLVAEDTPAEPRSWPVLPGVIRRGCRRGSGRSSSSIRGCEWQPERKTAAGGTGPDRRAGRRAGASPADAERTMLELPGTTVGQSHAHRRAYVDAVRGTKAQIYDTRKTTPGWRPAGEIRRPLRWGAEPSIGSLRGDPQSRNNPSGFWGEAR